MTVINKKVREAMVERLVKRAYDAQDKLMNTDLQNLALPIYNAYHTAEQQALMQQLPSTFFQKASHIRLNSALISKILYLYFPENMLLPYAFDVSNYIHLDRLKDYNETVYSLVNSTVLRYVKLQQDKQNFAEELHAVIQTARTYKKLWELWGDSYEVLKDLVPLAVGNPNYLPALNTARLNKIIGLPV